MIPRPPRLSAASPLVAPTLAVAALSLLATACSDYELTQFQAQDLFYQEPAGEVDIVLVVDNSCSMQPYQQKLGENFDSFLTYLQEGLVDYHIGVLTTTLEPPGPVPGTQCDAAAVAQIPAGGYLVGGEVITADTQGAENIFEELVNVGICGAGAEMGLESAYRALSPPLSTTENIELLRPDAMLSVIFVSDEEDSSLLPVHEYVNYFRGLKGLDDRDAVNVNALVVEDLTQCTQQQIASGAVVGSRYVYAAEETDGLLGNICADDFADILTELSYRASRLRDTFYLTRLPKPSSLFVAVNDVEVPCTAGDWTYQTEGEGAQMVGKLVFERDRLPPPDSVISVTYDYGNGDPADFCVGETAE